MMKPTVRLWMPLAGLALSLGTSGGAGQPASPGGILRTVKLTRVTSQAQPLGAPEAQALRTRIRAAFQTSAKQQGSAVLVSETNPSAQFNLTVDLLRAGHFQVGQSKARAAALVRFTIIDTATGAQVHQERHSRSVAAPRQDPHALSLLLTRPANASTTPLGSALAQALREGSHAALQEVTRFPAHLRLIQAKPARIPDEDIPGKPLTDCTLVRIDGGSEAGLTPGARLHFRRYQSEGMGGAAEESPQVLSPPIDTLVVLSVAPTYADARTSFGKKAESLQPRVGDLVRMGDHTTSRGVIASILPYPRTDEKAQGLAKVLASHVEDNLQEVFERAWRAAGLKSPPRDKLNLDGKVSAQPDGTYKCEVEVSGNLLGKPYRVKLPMALPGNPQRPGVTAQEVWSRLLAQLPEAVGPVPAASGSNVRVEMLASRTDPGLLKVLRGAPDEDFRRQPQDMPIVTRLVPAQSVYRTGQTVHLEMESPKADCYVKVFSIDAVTRRSFQLWPRQLSQPEMDRRVRDDPAEGLIRQGEAAKRIEIVMAEPGGSFFLTVLALRKHPKSEEAYRRLTSVIQAAYPPEQDETPASPLDDGTATLVASRGPRPVLDQLQAEVDRGAAADSEFGWLSIHAATTIRCELLSGAR